jgi:predicted phosphoribosyltransferase
MFRNREDAGLQLARELGNRALRNPVVLGIPRGGVVVGAVVAQEIGAELDVILARKLRAPGQPELALGAITETGRVYLNHPAEELLDLWEDYLRGERRYQMAEIARRKDLYRSVRPPAQLAGRSVIVTDDGIATGSTMNAALRAIQGEKPFEVIVAVPVGAPDRLEEIRPLCDEVLCLLQPALLWAIGQHYEDFASVDDQQVIRLLRSNAMLRHIS